MSIGGDKVSVTFSADVTAFNAGLTTMLGGMKGFTTELNNIKATAAGGLVGTKDPLSGLSNAISTADTKVQSFGTRLKGIGSAVAQNATSFGVATASIWGVYNAYDGLIKVQIRAEQASNRVRTTQTTLNALEAKRQAMLEKGNATAEQVAMIDEKIANTKAKLATGLEREADLAGDVQEAWAGFASQVGPQVVAAMGSIAQVGTVLAASSSKFGVLKNALVNTIPSLLGFKSRVTELQTPLQNLPIGLENASKGGLGIKDTFSGIGGVFAAASIAAAGLGVAFVALATNAGGVRTALNNVGIDLGKAVPQIKSVLSALGDFGDKLELTLSPDFGPTIDQLKALQAAMLEAAKSPQAAFQTLNEQLSIFTHSGSGLQNMASGITQVGDDVESTAAGVTLLASAIANLNKGMEDTQRSRGNWAEMVSEGLDRLREGGKVTGVFKTQLESLSKGIKGKLSDGIISEEEFNTIKGWIGTVLPGIIKNVGENTDDLNKTTAEGITIEEQLQQAKTNTNTLSISQSEEYAKAATKKAMADKLWALQLISSKEAATLTYDEMVLLNQAYLDNAKGAGQTSDAVDKLSQTTIGLHGEMGQIISDHLDAKIVAVDYGAALTDLDLQHRLVQQGTLAGVKATEEWVNSTIKGNASTNAQMVSLANLVGGYENLPPVVRTSVAATQEYVKSQLGLNSVWDSSAAHLASMMDAVAGGAGTMFLMQKGMDAGAKAADEWVQSLVTGDAQQKATQESLAELVGGMDALPPVVKTSIEATQEFVAWQLQLGKALDNASAHYDSMISTLQGGTSTMFELHKGFQQGITDADEWIKSLVESIGQQDSFRQSLLDAAQALGIDMTRASNATTESLQSMIEVALKVPSAIQKINDAVSQIWNNMLSQAKDKKGMKELFKDLDLPDKLEKRIKLAIKIDTKVQDIKSDISQTLAGIVRMEDLGIKIPDKAVSSWAGDMLTKINKMIKQNPKLAATFGPIPDALKKIKDGDWKTGVDEMAGLLLDTLDPNIKAVVEGLQGVAAPIQSAIDKLVIMLEKITGIKLQTDAAVKSFEQLTPRETGGAGGQPAGGAGSSEAFVDKNKPAEGAQVIQVDNTDALAKVAAVTAKINEISTTPAVLNLNGDAAISIVDSVALSWQGLATEAPPAMTLNVDDAIGMVDEVALAWGGLATGSLPLMDIDPSPALDTTVKMGEVWLLLSTVLPPMNIDISPAADTEGQMEKVWGLLSKVLPPMNLNPKPAIQTTIKTGKAWALLSTVVPPMDINNKPALSKVDAVISAIKKISQQHPTVTVTVKYDTSGKPAGVKAAGGIEFAGTSRTATFGEAGPEIAAFFPLRTANQPKKGDYDIIIPGPSIDTRGLKSMVADRIGSTTSAIAQRVGPTVVHLTNVVYLFPGAAEMKRTIRQYVLDETSRYNFA